MRNAARLARALATGAALAALSACAALYDPEGVGDAYQQVAGERYSDLATSALTRGDYASAERHAIAALRRDPKDPYALITAGLTYQATGRYEMARQYYEVIVTNQPAAMMVVPGGDGVMHPRSVVEVAQANLALIDRLSGRGTPRTVAQSGKAPQAMAALHSQDTPPSSAAGVVSEGEANAAGRFRILKRLLDEGLITQAEYNQRRAANVGALTPFSAPPPSQGLERPIPADAQVVGRLRALADALEGRAITPRQHSEERSAILDALLPAGGGKAEVPPRPPKDLIEAGAAIGRVERLRAAGLLSAAEAEKEKAAVSKALEGYLAQSGVAGADGLRPGPAPTSAAAAAPSRAGVRLARLKSEAGAQTRWASIKAKFPEQLGKMDAVFPKIGEGKDALWAVVAGPLENREAAQALCKTLKLHRQACDPVTY